MVEIGNRGLGVREVVAVAREDAEISLTPEALDAMAASAAIVERLASSDEPVYGVSTGFGSLATTSIPADRRADLQRALIRSHAAGMGPPVEREVVRAMMALRARSLAMGYSGARPEIAEAIVAMLNADVTPVVPEYGSLGASGDLAPLAHCALTLMGEGEAFGADGARQPAADALRAAGLDPIVLRAKEGLALINGTDGIMAMLALSIEDLERMLRVADVTAAMSVEALLGTDRGFAAPASVDSVPTSAMQEDHVSMGWSAARKLRSALDNLTGILAVELVAAARGLELREPLDPDVAERPEDLVVYGGTGRAARSWEAFDAIVRALQTLGDDETLLVQSGKPVGVFRTHEWAPRVLIANSNLVPEWANWDEFRRLEALGLTMYGQMTAGSWIYIGSQGIVQGTYECFAEIARRRFDGSLAGTITLTAGLGGMGGAQPLAVTMNEGVALCVEVDRARARRRVETRYLDRVTEDLD